MLRLPSARPVSRCVWFGCSLNQILSTVFLEQISFHGLCPTSRELFVSCCAEEGHKQAPPPSRGAAAGGPGRVRARRAREGLAAPHLWAAGFALSTSFLLGAPNPQQAGVPRARPPVKTQGAASLPGSPEDSTSRVILPGGGLCDCRGRGPGSSPLVPRLLPSCALHPVSVVNPRGEHGPVSVVNPHGEHGLC